MIAKLLYIVRRLALVKGCNWRHARGGNVLIWTMDVMFEDQVATEISLEQFAPVAPEPEVSHRVSCDIRCSR